mgnify:CR=1 FL=1
MSFEMPRYHHPDFTEDRFVNAPDAVYEVSEKDGVAPDNYHSTSMYPEYFKINGEWKLAEESQRFLKENGAVYFEIGYDQGEAVKHLLSGHGFKDTKVIKDLSGRDRVVCGKWNSAWKAPTA